MQIAKGARDVFRPSEDVAVTTSLDMRQYVHASNGR